MEKKPITTDQLGEIIEQSKKKNGQRIHRDNLQAFLRDPDKFNPTEATQPQPLKTFILFDEIHDPTTPGPDPRKILATIQATDESAAAAHLGGEYFTHLALGYAPSILLPKNVFKPLRGNPAMMELRKDGLIIRIDARCVVHTIRIEEIPNIIAS